MRIRELTLASASSRRNVPPVPIAIAGMTSPVSRSTITGSGVPRPRLLHTASFAVPFAYQPYSLAGNHQLESGDLPFRRVTRLTVSTSSGTTPRSTCSSNSAPPTSPPKIAHRFRYAQGP